MIEEMLATHSLLVKIFLGVLVAGVFLPFMYGKDMRGFKKMSFIYTMVFQALITMIAFSGLVAIFAGNMSFALPIIIMVAVWVVMMILEIKKHKNIKVAPMQDESKFEFLKSKFIKVSIIQVILVALMVVMMILKSKGMLF